MVLPTHGTAPQFTRTRAPHSNANPLQGQAARAHRINSASLADSGLSRVNAVPANRGRAVVPRWSVWS